MSEFSETKFDPELTGPELAVSLIYFVDWAGGLKDSATVTHIKEPPRA